MDKLRDMIRLIISSKYAAKDNVSDGDFLKKVADVMKRVKKGGAQAGHQRGTKPAHSKRTRGEAKPLSKASSRKGALA